MASQAEIAELAEVLTLLGAELRTTRGVNSRSAEIADYKSFNFLESWSQRENCRKEEQTGNPTEFLTTEQLLLSDFGIAVNTEGSDGYADEHDYRPNDAALEYIRCTEPDTFGSGASSGCGGGSGENESQAGPSGVCEFVAEGHSSQAQSGDGLASGTHQTILLPGPVGVREGTPRDFCDDGRGNAGSRFFLTTWAQPNGEILVQDERIRHVSYTMHECPTTRRVHWHVYLEFKGRGRLTPESVLKRLGHSGLPGPRPWIQVAFGSKSRILSYMRSGSRESRIDFVYEPSQVGPSPTSGRAAEAFGAVSSYSSKSKFQRDYAVEYARYQRHFDALWLELHPPPVQRVLKCALFWGDTGTGKSWIAREVLRKATGFEPYSKRASDWWWDGYNQESGVIVDDFIGDQGSANFKPSTSMGIDDVLRLGTPNE